MPEREGERDIQPQSGGTGGVIPIPPSPPPPPPSPIFQMLGLVAAVAGVIVGLLGQNDALLILCGLSAVFIAVSLFVGGRRPVQTGGTGGVIPIPRPKFLLLALVAAIAGVVAGLLGYDVVLLILCGLSAVLNLISLLVERKR